MEARHLFRWRVVLGAGLAIFASLQLVPVERTNPPARGAPPAPAAVLAVLRRSCFDCHSHETRWPWYAYVAPMSFELSHDVAEARDALNFSLWGDYDVDDRIDLLEEIWEEVEEEHMPPWFYLPLHLDARLDESDRARIRHWVEGSVETLEAEGAAVSSISLPRIDEIPNAVTAMMMPEPLAYHQKWLNERPDDYGESVRFRLELAAAIPAVAYVQAQRFREMVVQEWREQVFSKVDVLACPTTAVSAPAIDESELSTTFNLIRLTNPLNLIGTPCVSLPCGFTEAGLPIGLQLVGRWFDEATVLRAAFAYEQATDWHKRRPAVG